MNDLLILGTREAQAIGQRLRGVREHHGLSEEAICERLGIAYQAYCRFESGERAVTAELLAAMRRHFCTSADWILFGAPAVQSPEQLSVYLVEQDPDAPPVPARIANEYATAMAEGAVPDRDDEREISLFETWRRSSHSTALVAQRPPPTPREIACYLGEAAPVNIPQGLAPEGEIELLPRHKKALAETLVAQHAASTRRAYRSAWENFVRWCEDSRYDPLPAHHQVAASYMVDVVSADSAKVTTAKRHAAAVRLAHILAGYHSPTDHPLFQQALRGIVRIHGTQTQKKQALSLDDFYRILDAIDTSTLQGLRDKALIAIGFFGAFRRSELVGLRLENISFQDRGIIVTVMGAKTDRDAKGQQIVILRRSKDCPVQMLRDWLQASRITGGTLFRRVRGRVVGADKPLNSCVVASILKTYAKLIGIDHESISGHSLRAGFITTAAQLDVGLDRIQRVSRHRSLPTLIDYIREEDCWRNHASEKMNRRA